MITYDCPRNDMDAPISHYEIERAPLYDPTFTYERQRNGTGAHYPTFTFDRQGNGTGALILPHINLLAFKKWNA